MTDASHKSQGILAGLLAGAFWGLSFLIPRMLSGVHPIEVATGRFAWFGLISLATLFFQKKLTRRSPLFTHAKSAIIFSLSGYSLYYSLLVLAIQFTGIPISSLIIGLLPVTISLVSGDRVARPKLFRSALGVIVVGLAILNFEVFDPHLLEKFPHPFWGMIISLVCLVLWSVFAVLNSRFVKRHADVHLAEWTSVLGVYSGLTMLVIFLFVRSDDSDFSWKLIGLTGILGIFSTFIATRLWNYASRVLPASLCAQLIVSETVFALLYGFIYEWQWPTAVQWTSMILLISGVCIAIQAFRVKQNG